MSKIPAVLIGLAVLAFLGAIFTAFAGPISGIPAESLSRACTNLAVLAIALMLLQKRG